MVEFTTIILKFGGKGEKTGWTYIEIPADIAQQLKPGNKKSFRVKGTLDQFYFCGAALMPMGEGNFVMSLNAEHRKGMGKRAGAALHVKLELDNDYSLKVPDELIECFEDEPDTREYFYSLSKSHQGYFIKWIDSAKTEATKINRIVQTISALSKKIDYGAMIRSQKKLRKL